MPTDEASTETTPTLIVPINAWDQLSIPRHWHTPAKHDALYRPTLLNHNITGTYATKHNIATAYYASLGILYKLDSILQTLYPTFICGIGTDMSTLQDFFVQRVFHLHTY